MTTIAETFEQGDRRRQCGDTRRSGWFKRRNTVGRLVACLLGITLAPRWALAQSHADRIAARALADEGQQALSAKQFEIAAERFSKADAIVHAPTFVLAQARALVGLGRFVEASERLELILREGVAENAPKSWRTALADAKLLSAEMQSKIAWLTIAGVGGSAEQVFIDERPIPQEQIGDSHAMDPGAHCVRVEKAGYESQRLDVDLGEGVRRDLTIKLVPRIARSKGPRAAAVRASKAPDSRKSLRAKGSSPWPVIALGAGGLGIGVGVATGVMALHKRSNLKATCRGEVCPEQSQSDIDAYHSLGFASGLSLGLGLAATTTGFVLLQLRGDSNHQPTTGRLHLRVDPNYLGLEGAF